MPRGHRIHDEGLRGSNRPNIQTVNAPRSSKVIVGGRLLDRNWAIERTLMVLRAGYIPANFGFRGPKDATIRNSAIVTAEIQRCLHCAGEYNCQQPQREPSHHSSSLPVNSAIIVLGSAWVQRRSLRSSTLTGAIATRND